MSFGMCDREREVAEALRTGFWPGACPDELRAHVAWCKSCSQRVVLAQAFHQERSAASAQPRLESPGAIWWRAQLRRRNAAIERISRPILGAQVFALAVAVIAAAAFLISRAKQSVGLFAWIAEAPRALHLESLLPASMQNPTGAALMLAGVFAVVALIGGFAVFASSDKH